MDFKTEYKAAAESMTPTAEQLERIKANVLREISKPKKPAVYTRAAYIGGTVAACAVITVTAVTLLPVIKNSSKLTNSNQSKIGFAADVSPEEAFDTAALDDDTTFSDAEGISVTNESPSDDNTKGFNASHLSDNTAGTIDSAAPVAEELPAASSETVATTATTENREPESEAAAISSNPAEDTNVHIVEENIIADHPIRETAESEIEETAEYYELTMEIPAETMEVLAETMEEPAETMEEPAATMEVHAETMEEPAETAEAPSESMEEYAETAECSWETVDYTVDETQAAYEDEPVINYLELSEAVLSPNALICSDSLSLCWLTYRYPSYSGTFEYTKTDFVIDPYVETDFPPVYNSVEIVDSRSGRTFLIEFVSEDARSIWIYDESHHFIGEYIKG